MAIQFSFVIPIYNCADFIVRAVESILDQDGNDYELVLVDDGSTDDSIEKIAPYLDRAHIYLIQQVNSGPAAARNRGADEARGEYIYFLDSDDELMPDALAKVREMIQFHAQPDLVVGGHITVRLDGKEKVCPFRPLTQDNEKNFERFIFKKLGSISHGAAVVRASVFEQIRYPEEIRNNEDVVFFAHILASSRCVSLAAPLVKIFRRPDSQRHDHKSIRDGSKKVVAALFNQHILPPGLMKHQNKYAANRGLALFRVLYLTKAYKEAHEQYIQTIRSHPTALFHWAYLKKFLRLLLLSR